MSSWRFLCFATEAGPRRWCARNCAIADGCSDEKSFRASEKFDEPDVELVPVFLYSDAHGFHSWTRRVTSVYFQRKRRQRSWLLKEGVRCRF